MEIKTKYNHGQRIHIIVQGCEEYIDECAFCEGKGHIIVKDVEIGCPKCYGDKTIRKAKKLQWYVAKEYSFVIQKIIIELHNPNNKKTAIQRDGIYYHASWSGSYFEEKNCFASLEEALAECEKRNAEEAINNEQVN